MREHQPFPRSVSRLTPLAACCAGLFALAAPAAMASNIVVLNCNDSGTDSLRAAVAAASNGDTIDMTGLSCGLITLTTGAITIPTIVPNLSLNGPGRDQLAVTQFGTNDRIIKHQGNGTLFITNLSIVSGNLYSATADVFGGCIYSTGSGYLDHVGVNACVAKSQPGFAVGGGIYTHGALTAKHSTISGNAAIDGSGGGPAFGGGAFAGRGFSAMYSTIDANSATAAAGAPTSIGGGLRAGGTINIFASTISGNRSSGVAGGIGIVNALPALYSVTITNSTISGNTATSLNGGVYSNTATTLQNSTIAFNSAGISSAGGRHYSPGLAFNARNGASFSVNLQSSLVSNNTYGTSEDDFSTEGDATHIVTISGANNLIRVPFTTPPSGTIILSCPLLGPLRNNGGVTQTHALLSHSPAIDQGNNAIFISYDQRGSPYARVSGPAADIGAYEVNQIDILFNNGFEGCSPVL